MTWPAAFVLSVACISIAWMVSYVLYLLFGKSEFYPPERKKVEDP